MVTPSESQSGPCRAAVTAPSEGASEGTSEGMSEGASVAAFEATFEVASEVASEASHEAPIHGGDVLAAAARWGLNPTAILDFSANINPFGPPVAALAAAQVALADLGNYPEPYARKVRDALAMRHRLPQGAIMVTNGAAEAIHLLLRQAAGHQVALPVPGFAEYEKAARAVGATMITSCGFIPTANSVADSMGVSPTLSLAQGDYVLLCNPHNPTGHLLTPAQVIAVAATTAATVIVDEAFLDLTDIGEEGSVIPHAMECDNLVVLRSLTKFYALPGLRVGYAVARPERIAALDRLRDPWSVSTPAQAAALAALADGEYAQMTREWVRTERCFLAEELARIPGYRVVPPSANFILVQAPEAAWAIQDRIGPLGILIRDCRSFTGLTPCHMRLAVRSRPENLRLLEALCS